MRTRRSDLDRQDVVARRLALLSPVPLGEPRAAPPLALVRDSAARRPGERDDPLDRNDPMDRIPDLGTGLGPGLGALGGQDLGAGHDQHWWDDHTRVRSRSALPADLISPSVTEISRRTPGATGLPTSTGSAGASGVEVPVPGRHASRRMAAPPPWLPHLGVAHLAVIAVLVALGLAATSWWVVRSEPVPVSAPLREAVEPTLLDLPTDGAGSLPLAADEAATGTVVVDVAGEVRRPGVRELPAGSRVVDAIEAAGGPRPGVDLSGLNLARVLVDGEQVLVGEVATGPAAAPGASAPAPAGAPPAALVNLNTADQAALEALPEIGPVTAQAILAWREEHGGFTAVQELLEVSGIGPATLEAVAPLVTV